MIAPALWPDTGILVNISTTPQASHPCTVVQSCEIAPVFNPGPACRTGSGGVRAIPVSRCRWERLPLPEGTYRLRHRAHRNHAQSDLPLGTWSIRASVASEARRYRESRMTQRLSVDSPPFLNATLKSDKQSLPPRASAPRIRPKVAFSGVSGTRCGSSHSLKQVCVRLRAHEPEAFSECKLAQRRSTLSRLMRMPGLMQQV
jgi:hypothetical protein